MKTKNNIGALRLLILLLTLTISAAAQSGRTVQTQPLPAAPVAAPAPSPSANQPPKSPDVKPATAARTAGEQYKLVFPPSYDGKRSYSIKETAARAQARSSYYNNLVEQLNRAGTDGYKLATMIENYPVAIMKSDEAQFEYAWFETLSRLPFEKNGFEDEYEKFAQQGFRVVDHIPLISYCEYVDPQNSYLGEDCEYSDFFLLEKQSGVKQSQAQILLRGVPGWGVKPSAELTTEIKQQMSDGFYPVKVFSKFDLLLEQAKPTDELSSDDLDVQVVRSDVEKKVNQLAKDGYRLAATNNGLAVMFRRKTTAAVPATYVWLDTRKKDFEQRLAKLQAAGAVYQMTYFGDKGVENALIFEQKPSAEGKRREYKVLKFELDVVEKADEQKVYQSLTPSAKETLKQLNQLVEQGFTVRDLFSSDKASVLLERESN